MLPNPTPPSITTSFTDGTCTVHIPESLTVTEAVSFQQICQAIFRDHTDLKKLTLDFSATTFMDSSGLGSLVICRRLCEKNHAALDLEEVGPQVMMVLSMTDLDKVFTISQQTPDEEKSSTRLSELRTISTHPSVNSKAKRAIDIVGGLIGLIITSLLYIPIAIAIYIDDPGPILFSQIRCSWMGRRFQIWKFRSMVVDAESLKETVKNEVEGPLFKNENDPRVTKVGRFLRKSSLDEFPQFWNVLKGDMSLVGTRPPTPAEIEDYEVPAWQRLNVKPGLTGEWQVSGRSTIKKFEDVIRLDMRYQENWSLMYDIKLIVKTVLVLFTKESGAA
ncbi:sugar transferase [Oscillatoria sp. CS-180]|nr:sugar transferase [Oscillatoria sp. CS-180]MDB9529142.1 sugar transferase [Oscillatoria sp. CS-180]